jgi:perosamine synthetase
MQAVKNNIAWATPHLWGHELEYVAKAVKSTWISGGSFVDQLEADFAKYIDSPHVIATSNGTTALHLAMLAADLKPNDEVIVPGFGFMAAANICLHMGLKPVFSEVDPNTWCMRAQDIEPLINHRTKAVIPVHTYGQVCDIDPILELCSSHQLTVIEDAAESIGSRYKGRMTGTVAHLGTFSFHATKTITTGEGGAVTTHSAELAEKMRLYRSHGMRHVRYMHEVAGHNFRLTNMQAALGCAQLEHISKIEKSRKSIQGRYVDFLGNQASVKLQGLTPHTDPLVWACALELKPEFFPQGRDEVMRMMLAQGVETRPGFYPASAMPHLYGQVSLPECERIARSVISLPSSPPLTAEEIDHR